MTIQSSNSLLEIAARLRYLYLRHILGTLPEQPVEYRNLRWYRYDRRHRVTRVARSYFEIMQP